MRYVLHCLEVLSDILKLAFYLVIGLAVTVLPVAIILSALGATR